ncbi:MAG TPA: hypothetical protein VMJ32_17240 [Pirellulales bacterium]|nr:hypothetical protein [Pirellulales bacterium]
MRQVTVLLVVILVCTEVTAAKTEYVTVSLGQVANELNNRIPNMPEGMQTLGGVPFDLLPKMGKNSWNAAVGTTVGIRSTQTMVLPVNIYGATAVDTLINTSQGVAEATTVSLTFVCSDGTTHTSRLKEGEDIRDWYDGEYVNAINEKSTVRVFDGVAAAEGAPHGRIDMQTVALPKEFASRTLAYIILIDTGVTGNGDVQYSKSVLAQRAFINGVTVSTEGNAGAQATNTKQDEPSQTTTNNNKADEGKIANGAANQAPKADQSKNLRGSKGGVKTAPFDAEGLDRIERVISEIGSPAGMAYKDAPLDKQKQAIKIASEFESKIAGLSKQQTTVDADCFKALLKLLNNSADAAQMANDHSDKPIDNSDLVQRYSDSPHGHGVIRLYNASPIDARQAACDIITKRNAQFESLSGQITLLRAQCTKEILKVLTD